MSSFFFFFFFFSKTTTGHIFLFVCLILFVVLLLCGVVKIQLFIIKNRWFYSSILCPHILFLCLYLVPYRTVPASSFSSTVGGGGVAV